MEQYTTFGFTMECDDSDSNKYLNIKAEIEKLCKQTLKYSKLYNKNPLLQYFPIKKGLYMTCCATNNQVQFGVYCPNKNSDIIQHLSKNANIELDIEDIRDLKNRIEITARNAENVKISQLENAWERIFNKIKSADLEMER